ncbi:MAG: cysteine synthase A [Candidatus Bathyarchaeota archaeon]|nr:cysteine synthase A [Candidatus Bathyarchaeota archaeon]
MSIEQNPETESFNRITNRQRSRNGYTMAAKSVLDFVGNTPLIQLNSPEGVFSTFEANLYAKVEYVNPSGSVKDRIAKYMIEQAEKRGELKPGYTIVEATSGNTGIAFSMAGAAKGYKVVIVMCEAMTEERRNFMRAYGAEVVSTPACDGLKGAVKKAKQLAKQSGWWMPAQFDNYDNVEAHRLIMGKEIIEQVPDGWVDAFVAGVGTGGTLMGVAKSLKEVNPEVKIVAAQPASSQELTGGKAGEHRIDGIGDGFIPSIVDQSLIDEVINVKDEDAVNWSRLLAREKGLFAGISSGANVDAAVQLARRMKKGQNVVTVLPDSADRYASLGIFTDKKAEEIHVPKTFAP